jgi:hypothetical protein
MHEKSDVPLFLSPLHGVELLINNNQHQLEQNNNLPFHLNVTINYDTYIQSTTLPIWTMLDEGIRYSSLIELYKDDNNYKLGIKCEGQGSFTFDRSKMCIDWQSAGTGFEHYLQSLGLAAWLELQGIPCIHANAITLNNNAALIIAPSRTGKSTLTTHLTSHKFKLMTDDMAAIHPAADGTFTIYPSWPKIRLWPDMADSLIGMEVETKFAINTDLDTNINRHTEKHINKYINSGDEAFNNSNLAKQPNKMLIAAPQKKQVHQNFTKYEIEFNSDNNIWRHQPATLKAIYYLERLEETANVECEIEKLSASNALIILLQNSMLADGYVDMGIEVKRLTSLAKLLGSIPLYKISYRSGLSNLDNVAKCLKEHLK